MTHTDLSYGLKLLGRLAWASCALLWGAPSPAARPAAAAAAPPAPRQQPAAKERAEKLTEEGAAALGGGDRARARELFRRALESDASNVAAHTYLGVMADQEGDLAAAEKHFATAAAEAPLLPSARNNHGAILLRLGRVREAARQFEVSLKLDRNQPSALFNLAQTHFQAGTPEELREAFLLFERAQQLAPDAEAARALVVTSLRLGDRAAAARYFGEYLAALPRAPGEIAAARPRSELGAALLENGLPEEASVELAAASAAEPSNPEHVVRLARAHLARKDVRAAGRALESAVARGVEAAPVYALLADVYEASGHVENAIPAMRLAIERDPKNESYRFRYGMLLTDTKAPAAAVIRLREALKEFPRSSRLWFALGVAQSALDKPEEAAGSFQRAHELEPNFAPALAYLGMTYDQQGRFDEAVEHYERALALDGRLGAAHYLAAEAILKRAQADERRAEAHLKEAVALEPGFAPARVSLAKLYMRGERLAEAVALLQAAVSSAPELAEAHYNLGRALMRLKRTAEAKAALDEFKRLSEAQREQARQSPRDIMRRLANVNF
ncbi:MAG TPA: tetratricopeptide repeat protein [Pyrinomonadaceae bacterium]|jgi:tetratricopeptide (TPR) repeat protein